MSNFLYWDMLPIHYVLMYALIDRYHEVFYMIDTCQAESMHQKFYSPNILAVASSMVGEDSLSVGLALPFHNMFPFKYGF